MLKLNVGLIRGLVVSTLAIVFLAAAPLARAETPGTLAQSASPNDCIKATTSELGCMTTASGLRGASDVTVSPDGKNVYAIGPGDDAVAEFSRDSNGSLTPVGCIADQSDAASTSCSENATASGLVSPVAIAISPDGSNVYVTGRDSQTNGAVAEFVRNADGSLTPLANHRCISEMVDNSTDCDDRGVGLQGPTAIAVSPDGNDVYVTDQSGRAITELTRATDGSLSTADCIGEVDSSNTDCASQAPGIHAADAVVVSPDGHNVYVGSTTPGTIAEFTRATNGSLTQLASPNACIEEHGGSAACGTATGVGINTVNSLAISPNGSNVYATSGGQFGDVAEFARDPNAQGALTQLPSPHDCIEESGSSEICGVTNGVGLNGASQVVVSPDGENVYVATGSADCCDEAIGEFSRAADGSLSQSAAPDQCIDSGSDCQTTATGLGGGHLVISPDDKSLYATGAGWDVAELARVPFRHTLTVSLAGSGSGAVSDDSGAISCPSACSSPYNEGTQVTLTATPASGSTFAGWGGACSGTSTCQVTISADTAVTATFTGVPGTPGRPTPVLTGAPTAVTDAAAAFSGTVNPEGLPTTVVFQYGLDRRYSQPGASGPNYTQQTPAQPAGSDFTTHGIGPIAVSGLVPNALYHVRLVATNTAGSSFGQDVTFTTALAPAPSPPTLGQTFNVAPVSGLVLVLLHGHLVPITQLEQLPAGVAIDSLHGTFQLTSDTGSGGSAHDAAAKGQRVKTQTGNFGGAVVRIHQTKSGRNRGLTTVMMVESAFKGAPSQAVCNAGGARDAQAARSKTIQLLHASAHGKFTTTGRYSAATVRGTVWTMAARCDGTLTHDITDSVVVTDFIRHRTIVLHAGQSYLAPNRRKH